MQRIEIVTSLSYQPDMEPGFGFREVEILSMTYRAEFDIVYRDNWGREAMRRNLVFELSSKEGHPFSPRELARFKRIIAHGPTSHTVGVADHHAQAFRFDEDYVVHIEDAGRLAEFFDGMFEATDIIINEKKQLSNGQQALPAPDR